MASQVSSPKFYTFAYFVFCIFLAACSPPPNQENESQSSAVDTDSSMIALVANKLSKAQEAAQSTKSKGSLPSESSLFSQVGDSLPHFMQDELKVGIIKLPEQRSAERVVQDLHEITSRLGEQIITERDAVRQKLIELGYQPLNEFSDGVSGRAQLEFAMKRAEVGSNYNNGAKDLLIYFRNELQINTVAMQTDPVLQGLGDIRSSTFVFSDDLQATRNVRLDSLGLEKAVAKFSAYQPSYFEIKTHAIKCCLGNLAPQILEQKLEKVILDSRNHKEFFTTLLSLEPPPPSQKEKMRVFTRGYQAESIARQVDPNLNKIIDSLEDKLPERYRSINNAPAETVQTFKLQKEAIREVAEQAANAGNSQLANFLQGIHLGGHGSDFDAHVDAVRGSAKAFTPSATGNASTVTARSSVSAVKAFDRFVQRTFEGTNSISKKFASASRSIRGPGGISFGAEIIESPKKLPQKVAWISHSKVPEFGYFMFKLGENDSVTARSKWMYAESAAAAWIALFNPISERAAFKEGEVFAVVTLDRFYEGELSENQRPIAINPALMGYQLAWSSARVDFWFSTGKAVRNDILSLHCVAIEPCQAIAEEPTETAWEAVGQLSTWQFHDKPHRIRLAPITGDHQISLLAVCSENSADCLNSETPSPHMTISPFAREDLLKAQILQELINLSAPECEQHSNEIEFLNCLLPQLKLSISMIIMMNLTEKVTPEIATFRAFQSSLEAITSGVSLAKWLKGELDIEPEPRNDLAKKIQPLIDWLITYHPDFIRLNDFAEAFTLLRWAKNKGISGTEVRGLTAELVPAIYPIPTLIEISANGLKAKVN